MMKITANLVRCSCITTHCQKQMILCENDADVMYLEKWHSKSVTFVQSVKRLLACSLVCAFSWWRNVQWSVMHCGKFGKKAPILQDSDLDWQVLTVTLNFTLFWSFWYHICLLYWFLDGEKTGEFSNWRHTCTPVSFYTMDLIVRRAQGQVLASDHGHRGLWPRLIICNNM